MAGQHINLSDDTDKLHLSSLTVVDLDGDDQYELVLGGADGKVHAWHANGSAVAGFPTVAMEAQITASVAAADLSSDSVGPELVAGDILGNVKILSSSGNVLSEIVAGSGLTASPIIADADDDGILDIVLSLKSGYVSFWNSFGELFWAYATDKDPSVTVSTQHPSSADLDGDGDLELLYAGLDGKLYCKQLSTSGSFASSSVARGWNGLLGDRGESSNGPTGDLDSDQFPDEYELVQFGSLDFRPDQDNDQDSFSNYTEFVVGTDPNDANDDQLRSHMRLINLNGEQPEIELQVPVKAGRSYDLMHTENLADAWSSVESVDVASDALHTFTRPMYTVTGQGFYKIVVNRTVNPD